MEETRFGLDEAPAKATDEVGEEVSGESAGHDNIEAVLSIMYGADTARG